ncbi:MAG: phosphate ABC transporter permease [Aphanocapsa feldmannii 277cV]|uniref:Phosphate ABC transporter permease n=1 Tax=Aphanocapsa feldmannii 277cV TaxID=2507553 RepID=A0A524RQL9_9CHRO|nr:MAG: phosphate ABC transporter permease [Aphanocapsa feldmannii 277cV]
MKSIFEPLFQWRVWWYSATLKTKVQLQRTKLGSIWLGLANLLVASSLGTVYGTLFKVSDWHSYFAYLAVGITTWTFMASVLSSSPRLFTTNKQRLLSTNLTPAFVCLEDLAFALQTFIPSIITIVIASALIFKPIIFINTLTLAIFPFFSIIMMIFAFHAILSCLGAFFHDLYQIIPIVLQLSFLTSPILYAKEALGDKIWIAKINPLYVCLEVFRTTILEGDLQVKANLMIFGISSAAAIFGLWILKKARHRIILFT